MSGKDFARWTRIHQIARQADVSIYTAERAHDIAGRVINAAAVADGVREPVSVSADALIAAGEIIARNLLDT